MLDHYHYRRWYRTTTRTDLCCFHLQLNQYLAPFLQHHKHKERTASGGMYRQGYVVTCAPNAHDLQMRQLPCQYAYGQRQEFVPIRLRIRPRCWHYTATRTTPSLGLANTPAITTLPTERSRRYACDPTTN